MSFIAASAIITRSIDKKVLIGRRSLNKKMGPGEWETIGGSINDNETLEECIKREVKEELSVAVKTCYHFKDYKSEKGDIRVFIITLLSDPVLNRDDFEELKWVMQDEIETLTFVLNCKQRLFDYFSLI